MNFKNIQTILAKLGIFRSGSYEWSGDAKERPMEAIDDDIYNAERDYVNKEDIEKVTKTVKDTSIKKGSAIFWTFMVINILLILILLMAVGFNFGTAISIGFLLLYFFLFKKGKLLSSIKLTLVGLVLIPVSFISISIFTDGSESLNEGNANEETTASKEMISTEVLLSDVASFSGIESYETNPDEVVWTAARVDLNLNDGAVLTSQSPLDVMAIQKYFKENNWTSEIVGFTYVAENDTDSFGYMNSNTDSYQGAMCIVYPSQNKIACGLGPSAP